VTKPAGEPEASTATPNEARVIFGGGDGRGEDAARGRDPELRLVLPEEEDMRAVDCEHLGDENPELSVADDGDARAWRDRNGFHHAARGGERLGEDGLLVGHVGRDSEQISRGEPQHLRVRTVAMDDAEHGSSRTVPGVAGSAAVAGAAAGVDLAGDARALRERSAAGIEDLADELVADRPGEAGVAAHELEVRVADAGQDDANGRLAVAAGDGHVVEGGVPAGDS